MRALAVLAAGSLAALPMPLSAQGLTLRMGRLFDDGGWTAYNLAWNYPLPGPLDAQLGGTFLRGPAASERLFGAALDASLFRGGRAGVYVVGGMGGGIGTGSAESWWRSWSAGVGYELVPTQVFSVGIETRYREMQPRRRAGAEVALRLSTSFGGARGAVPLERERIATEGRDETGAAVTSETVRAPAGGAGVRLSTAGTLPSGAKPPAERARDVIEIAEGEIGRRYRLGGTGDPGDGFDCSGLIQYAYQRIGIALPRRSVDQAKAGREIGRDESELLPGDVLTFSGSGGRVTHVGLYIGDGRFIHSASRGVQISRLGDDDPNGRYWYRRWVGARRIIADE
ncbi:MAG TPA: C40 family peptidase [Gemmatimonadales bacterium]